MHLADFLHDADAVLELEPPDLGALILKVLDSWPAHEALQLSTFINTILGHPLTPGSGPYRTNRRGELQEAISTAWAWLEGQALLIPDTRYGEGVVKLSARAKKIAKQVDPARLIHRGGAHPMSGNSVPTGFTAEDAKLSRKVFVVHGRDDAAKNEVALFLRAIGLDPIILHMRPNGGRHLLTKFREESEGAAFTVVLMTPDDEGGLAGTAERQPRARQNVVFELGFFIGKLGPGSVAALLKDAVEKPSDFEGIAYIAFDSGGSWKTLLARELNHVGVPFDHAKVFTA
jgi:predicted nucleotide-binding protein